MHACESSDSMITLSHNRRVSDDNKRDCIHPMDIILAILHCADDILRQDLMARLVKCQYSIPLILLDPYTGKLTYPLWSMRSIVKEWKSTINGREEINEGPVVRYSIPIVAFVRFGEQNMSKSMIINQVMCDSDQVFHHFFDRECKGGSCKSVLGDGLVDLNWYFPAGSRNDLFPSAICFLNLHGDTRKHQNQVSFLSRTCLTTFVLFSNKDMDEGSASVIKSLSVAPRGVVLLLCEELLSQETFKKWKQDVPRDKVDGCKIVGKNGDAIRKSIRLHIKRKIGGMCKPLSLLRCKEMAVSCGMDVDENKKRISQKYKSAFKLHDIMIQTPRSQLLGSHLRNSGRSGQR